MNAWIPGLLLATTLPAAALELATLTHGQAVAGFTCQALYEDAQGRVMGTRLLAPNGFVLDLLTIESVPQAFWWIRTTPDGSRGEPHACEHLLLGKGRRGRAVAALEDMRLATSTAYTDQLHTCYQFHTTAGLPTFLELFEAKLRALLQPDFLDEEIRREVCHYDVAEDEAGRLALVEKGTVYTEMVSSFEKPWYWGAEASARLVYGEGHPLYNNAGGDPRVMWQMEPDDLWRFHRESHFPANMGAIVSLPSSADLLSTLEALAGILERCDTPAPRPVSAGIGTEPLPPAQPAAVGTRVRAPYPSPRIEDPAALSLHWPSDLELDPVDGHLLDLFLQAFAGGETSTLYPRLVAQESRELDLGANSIYAYREGRLGHSITIALNGLRPAGLDDPAVDRVLAVIQGSLRALADCAPGDSLLQDFNSRVAALQSSGQRHLRDYLGSPPMFGHRSGNAGTWLHLLEQCERDGAFRRSLVGASRVRAVDSLLAAPGNPWTAAIRRWRLLERPPFVVVSTPSPELQQQVLDQAAGRRREFLAGVMQRLGLQDEQAALAAYRDEFEARSAALEAASADDPLPGFLPDPPMGLDDELDYSWEWPLFAARFPSMESATLALALDLRQWPVKHIALLPLLTETLCEVGLVLDGDSLAYPEMQQALRRQILGLSCHVEHSEDGKRLELLVEASGGTRAENRRALDWLKAVLEQPLYTEAALPRLRDRVAQRITELRNMPQWPEEYWVEDPAFAWRFRHDARLLAADAFLTRIQLLERAAWLLRDPGTAGLAVRQQELFRALGQTVLADSAARVQSLQEIAGGGSGGLALLEGTVEPELRETASELARALLRCSADLPAGQQGPLLGGLCRIWEEDFLRPPAVILAQLRDDLAALRGSGSSRAWLVGNPTDVAELSPGLKALCHTRSGATLRDPAPDTADPAGTLRALGTARKEDGLLAGLVHTDTRNGTVMLGARVAQPWSTAREDLLRCLAGKTYGGGGAHGFFMQTWAAGLAYSNGYRYREGQGRVSYYAERCPDVGATLEFVSRTLKQDAGPENLADYAVAQVFGPSRAADPFEDRARGMARDLIDGNDPARIQAFRQAVQALRAEPELERTLRTHLTAAHGPVLIGVGQSLADCEQGAGFVIGPEAQFQALEKALADAGEPHTVMRLTPSDFWLWPADRLPSDGAGKDRK